MSQYEKLTQTPVPKLIITLSIPTVLSMLVTNIYNLADTAFVGQLGNSASGAVGIVFGFMSIIQSFGFMFGQGGGSMLSRMLGAKKNDDATKTASTGFFSAFIMGLIISLVTFAFLDKVVMFLGSTDTIAPYAKTYIRYILVAAPFMTASFSLNNFLRYEGKASLGMVGLMTGGFLNIIGDPIFMFALKMGIAGAGLSTMLSQMVSFSILLYMFLSGNTTSKLSLKEFNARLIPDIATTGLPSLLRQGLGSVATIILNYLAGSYGDEAVAAMSIVSRISFFIFAIALGIGQGYQPVAAFNFGAKKYERVRQGFWFTFLLGEGLMTVGLIFVFIFSGSLISVFRNDATVIEIGTRALRLHCGALFFLPLTMVTEMLFQSTGHRFGASFLSACRSGVFFVPLLIILEHFRGLYGIQEAQPLAYVLTFLPALFFALWLLKRLDNNQKV